MKTLPLLIAFALSLAPPAAAQELYELDKGKGGHEPPSAPQKKSGPPLGGEAEYLFPEEPAEPGFKLPDIPEPSRLVAAKPAVDSAAALQRVVDSLASGKKVADADLAWAQGVAAGELQRLAASGDAELKFRAELSCATDAKKGLKCSAAERYQQLLDAKKADYEKIKAMLDGQSKTPEDDCPLQGCQ